MKLETVIIPVAGSGTRMLPATKSVPKELLPVYDTPVLQFALDEAVAAGAKRIVLVSHPSKPAIEEFISRHAVLEESLRSKGKTVLLGALKRMGVPAEVRVDIVYQDEPLGLGHAVLCARDHSEGGPVGVILPDDVVMDGGCLKAMADAFDPERMQSLIASLEVSQSEISSYGVFAFEEESSASPRRATALVEKPRREDAPSNHAAIGRYILSDCIFDYLAETGQGAGGEVQLTDAIASCGDIFAMPITAPRFDCGCHDGLFEASQYRRSSLKSLTQIAIAAE